MPYQKEEKSRFGGLSDNSGYNKTSSETSSSTHSGCMWFLMLTILLLAGAYAYMQSKGIALSSLPKYVEGIFETEEKEEEEEYGVWKAPKTLYRYKLEYQSDQAFFEAHPRNPNWVPYKKVNFEHFLYYSIQNVAKGVNYGIEHGDLAQIALELQQVCEMGHYPETSKAYRELFYSDMVTDIVLMATAEKGDTARATIYDVSYLIDIIRPHHAHTEDSKLIAFDLMNALNSEHADSVENKVENALTLKYAVYAWDRYSRFAPVAKESNLLQGVLNCPAFANDWGRSKRPQECMMKILERVAGSALLHNVPTENVTVFSDAATKDIESGCEKPSRKIEGASKAFEEKILPYLY